MLEAAVHVDSPVGVDTSDVAGPKPLVRRLALPPEADREHAAREAQLSQLAGLDRPVLGVDDHDRARGGAPDGAARDVVAIGRRETDTLAGAVHDHEAHAEPVPDL